MSRNDETQAALPNTRPDEPQLQHATALDRIGRNLVQGRGATIERIYVDFDGNVQFGVTIDDVPGQDIMRDIRRYLFFRPDEVEVPA